MVHKCAALLLALFFTLQSMSGAYPWTHGSAVGNAQSSLGTNLAALSQNSPEQPFVNIFSSNNAWFTTTSGGTDTGEEPCLSLDANGFINSTTLTSTSCTGSTTAAFVKLHQAYNQTLGTSPYYPAGTYDILYSGTCTFAVSGDASGLTTIGTGHQQFTVATPTNNGIIFDITGTFSGGSYCRNISVTLSTLTASWQTGCGQYVGGPYTSACFNPKFLKLFAAGRAFRFMDWMCTNDNTTNTTNYSSRPIPSQAFFGSQTGVFGGTGAPIACGVPVEYMVALCNAVNADCWFNMPTLSGANYVSGLAAYVAANLNSNLNAYEEYSNETWNTGFTQFLTLIQTIGAGNPSLFIQFNASPGAGQGANGCAASGTGSNSLLCNRAVMGYQSTTDCNLWRAAYTSAGRSLSKLNCVLAAQAADTFSASSALACTGLIQAANTSASLTGTALTLSGTTTGTFAIGQSVQMAGVSTSTTITGGSGTSWTVSPSHAGTATGAVSTTANSATACQGSMGYVAIAPYYGADVPISYTALSPDAGLTQLFSDLTVGCVYTPCTSAATTTGGPTAFSVTIGGASAVNGNCYGVTFNTTPTSGLSDTINVNGAGALPLLNNVGGDPSGYASTMFPAPLCYTSATSSGVVTPGWRLGFNIGVSGGYLAQAAGWMSNYATLTSGLSMNFVGYEDGQTYTDPVQTATELTTLYANANLDSRMGAAAATHYASWKTAGGQLLNQFNDIGPYNKFGNWSLLETLCDTDCTVSTTPTKPKYVEWVSWNQTVRCWWSGC